jgi:PRTRC genetic system protein B
VVVSADLRLLTPEDPPIPTTALVFFEGVGGSVFATCHPVRLDDGPLIGEGTPLSQASLQAFCSEVQGKTRQYDGLQVLPPEVLWYREGECLAWWRRGRVESMPFNAGGREFGLSVPWPHLLFAVTGEGRLHVAALAAAKRPTEDTPLHHAPLGNVGAQGALCLGSARHPKDLTPADIRGWTECLTRSAFTHVNHPHTLRLRGVKPDAAVSTSDHVRFWRSLARTKAIRFPREALAPMGVNVGEALRQWTRGGGRWL